MAITFNLTYGASVPTAARDVVAQVATYFATQFTDSVTLNFIVNWAAISGLGSSSFDLSTYSYAQVRSALSSDSKTSDDATTVANLPATDPISGTHSWTMARAEEKALGLIAGNATGSDGSMTFSSTAVFDFDNSNGVTAGQYDFYGVVAHEITELMGRQLNAIGNNVAFGPGYHPLDLFKYSGTGSHVYVGTTPGYFSVNNGATNLANFNTDPDGDFGDWASGIHDSFLAFSNTGVVNPVSAFDLRVMDVIGWDRVGAGIATVDHNNARYGNFGNDSRSDILFQSDNAGGSAVIWQTNSSGALVNTTSLGPIPSGFQIDGTGNFNSMVGDDILLRSSTSVAVWVMNGTTPQSVQVLGGTSPQWLNSGIGEFTGDGQSDLLFRNPGTNQIATWGVSNNALSIAPQVLGSAPSQYHIIAVDDFTGDHQADILFRNDTGDIAIWRVANNALSGVPAVVGSTSPSYHVVGTGDFDGNGANDILFRNDSGDLAEWLLNSQGQLLGAPSPIGNGGLYHTEGTGDLNGDGRSDIIFRDGGGTLVEWLMNGTSLLAPQAVIGSASTDFSIAAHHFDLV